MRKARYLDFPIDEYKVRYNRLRALMEESKIDALFLTNRPNVEYVTGFSTISWRQRDKQFYTLVTKNGVDDVVLIIDDVHKGNAENTSWVDEVQFWNKKVAYVDLALKVMKDRGLDKATIGMELGTNQRLWTTQEDFEKIIKGLPKTNIVDSSYILNNLRTIKSSLEIERLKHACDITCRALISSFESFYEGMNERDFSNTLVRNMLEQDADSPTYSNTGGYISLKANRPTQMTPTPVDRKIERGDFVRFDGGAVYRNYQADFMRIGYVGQKPPKECEKIYCTISKAMEGVDETIRPGATASQIYSRYLDTIQEEGYEKLLPDIWISAMDYWAEDKGTFYGHGIGIDIHEEPFLISGSDKKIEENMVIAIEVGLRVSPTSDYVLELEDNFVVTKKGCERLSSLDRKIWEITF